MTRKVLLTGASGFVGRHVLRQLLAQNIAVRIVARSGKVVEMAEQLESVHTSPDIFAESVAWWAAACEGVDTIIHAAWYTEPGQYLQSPKNLSCLQGTLAIAQGAVQAGVRRWIGVGTCFEYDLSNGGALSTDTPLLPQTPYAAAKAAAYLALSQYFSSVGVSFAWARLFYMFGEGEDARRLVPYLRNKLANGEVAELTSGHQIRDFMDVAQVASDLVKLHLSEMQGAVNICSGQGIPLRALVEAIADEYGRRDLLKFGARPDNLFDPPVIAGIKTVIR